MLKYWAHSYLHPTEAEAALEPAIAALGIPYRVQYPFFKLHHYADFALPDKKLIIEVDGASHNSNKQKLKDLQDTLGLEAMGWRVVRCTNEEAIRRPKETVAKLLTQRPIPLVAEEVAREVARLEALLPPKKPRKKRTPKQKPAKVSMPKFVKKVPWEFPQRPPLPL